MPRQGWTTGQRFGTKKYIFPSGTGHAAYDEGEKMNGVDRLRFEVARWLGTLKTYDEHETQREQQYRELVQGNWNAAVQFQPGQMQPYPDPGMMYGVGSQLASQLERGL